MSTFVPQLMRAVVANTAAEAGRQLANNGLGFLQIEGEDSGTDDVYYGSDYFYDDFGNYWQYDWFDGGGLDPFWQQVQDEYDYQQNLAQGNVYTINQDAPFALPSYRDITGTLDYQNDPWAWLRDLFGGPGPAPLDPQYGPAGTGQGLPGYCPKGTYHPVGDPYACVPFPASDPNAKKQQQQQKKSQQSAANALKTAQKKKDQSCPKDPKGRPVWFNPQTGRCELVPPCKAPAKFDSTSGRCLTPGQSKDLYGEDYAWVKWVLGAVGAALVLRGFAGDGDDDTKKPRRRTR